MVQTRSKTKKKKTDIKLTTSPCLEVPSNDLSCNGVETDDDTIHFQSTYLQDIYFELSDAMESETESSDAMESETESIGGESNADEVAPHWVSSLLIALISFIPVLIYQYSYTSIHILMEGLL